MTLVHLKVNEEAGYDRQDEPVTSGIPWPRGLLRNCDGLSLSDRQGHRLPMQARPLAFWPDGSVKWSLLTARLNAKGGGTTEFLLATNPGSRRGARAGKERGIKMIRGRQAIIIDTGVLRLTVDTKQGGFITEVQGRAKNGRWQSMILPGGLKLYVNRCDPDGGNRQRFTNGADPSRDRLTQPQPPPGFTNYAEDPAYSVSVIEEGPERIGLRVTGTHVDGQSRRFCPYVVHLYAYRNSARVDIQHTLIYTGIPQRDLIAGFGIEVPLRLADSGRRYDFAEDTGPGIETKVQPTPDHPLWFHGRLIQLTSMGYRADKWTDPSCGPVKIIEGGRNQGWAHLGDARMGCLAAIRDFWQQYPKAFEVDARQGLLKVELWPTSGAPWDLRRYARGCFPNLYEYAKKNWSEFPEETHGARGIAKTHEVSLWFHSEPLADRQTLARKALTFTQPLMLVASPAWYCSSGALGAVAPLDAKRFARPDRVVTDYIDFMLAERERNKWYGMVDYGDFQQTHAREDYNVPVGSEDPESYRWLFDVGGHAWLNVEQRPDQGLWLAFVRTGRLDYLQAAAAMTRHNRDLDVYHWGNFKGSGSRHNVNHWGCGDKEWRVSNPISLRWHHYLTGDAWTRESIGEVVATYQSYRELDTGTYTSGGALICGLLAKSELSGAAADLQALRNLADVFAEAVSPGGKFAMRMHVDALTGRGNVTGDRETEGSLFFLLSFGCMQTLVEVAELLDHRELSDALVRHACSRFETGETGGDKKPEAPTFSHVQVFAHAWKQTGDRRFLAFIRKTLTSLETVLHPRGRRGGSLETPPHFVPLYSRKQTCWLLGDIGVQAAFGMKALAGTRKAVARNRRRAVG